MGNGGQKGDQIRIYHSMMHVHDYQVKIFYKRHLMVNKLLYTNNYKIKRLGLKELIHCTVCTHTPANTPFDYICAQDTHYLPFLVSPL